MFLCDNIKHNGLARIFTEVYLWNIDDIKHPSNILLFTIYCLIKEASTDIMAEIYVRLQFNIFCYIHVYPQRV